MSGEKGKLYQDRLYGTKVLTPLAVAVIDTAEFQRLAGLRQLGFSDQVFRCATHTRFEHSVGTYFMCRTMMRRIVQNHDRLKLPHPGREISEKFAEYPHDALPDEAAKALETGRFPPSHQARWRGLTEVISAAGLIHDVGHVPFGHTLEDEFTGIFERHDSLAGPRLHTMLFDESSELARVFSDDRHVPWLPGLTNDELRRLLYLILNWKEEIEPLTPFPKLLSEALDGHPDPDQRDRLEKLRDWHKEFSDRKLFHPFMSDIVGNTICADLLDYLPRDRMNLGMDFRHHGRLLRYFTIQPGTLYQPEEGLRASILVTRKGRGGQRRDVATTVLDIMRERYQMAERVFYHHKKAATSAMLAKLTELSGLREKKPRDDDGVYPAPWTEKPGTGPDVPHMTHFSDAEFIDYLGRVEVPEEHRNLQRRLYQAIRYRRTGLYRTLLVIDSELAHSSSGEVTSFARVFRDNGGNDRRELERELAAAAGAQDGEVLIYCPSPKMQAKEVDVRVEIQEGRVLPLRLQRESFAYHADLNVLEQYYQELWRAYVFVSPALYTDSVKCRAIVDHLCARLAMSTETAYKKVRGHELHASAETAVTRAFESMKTFLSRLPFRDTPSDVSNALLERAATDRTLLGQLTSGADTSQRLSGLFEAVALRSAATALKGAKRRSVESRAEQLVAGTAKPTSFRNRADLAGSDYATFADYQRAAVEAIGAEGRGDAD